MDEASGSATANGPSAAERRRLARQKKILENSDSRMSRVLGRPSSATEPAPPAAEAARSRAPPASADGEPCPDPPDQSIHEVLRGPPPGWPAGAAGGAGMEALLRQMGADSATMGASAGAATGAPAAGAGWQLWDRYRWAAVALLALLTRLALLYGVATTLTQNVLLPLLLLETTAYLARLWAVPLRPGRGLLGTALMLCGVSPATLEIWGRYIAFLTQAWNDFMVYVFVIVLSFRLIGTPAGQPAHVGARASTPTGERAAPELNLPADELEYEF